MPQRWICCRCDNGWTVRSGGANVCGNSNCRHQKCGGCEIRTYSPGHMGPAQDRHNHNHCPEEQYDDNGSSILPIPLIAYPPLHLTTAATNASYRYRHYNYNSYSRSSGSNVSEFDYNNNDD